MLKVKLSPTRDLWLLILPLMFLPAAGLTLVTPFGILQPSDLLIFPLLGALYMGGSSTKHRPYMKTFMTLGLLFSCWILLGAFAISIKYNYFDNYKTILVSLFKAIKFILFAYAGLLAWKKVWNKRELTKLNYSLLWSGSILGVSLLFHQFSGGGEIQAAGQKSFESLNLMSVTMAILITYIVGVLVSRVESPRFNQIGWICVTLMAMGFFVSRGRGGWLAALVGIFYFFVRRGKRASSLVVALAGVSVIVGMYMGFPAFQEEVDKTFGVGRSFSHYRPGSDELNTGYRVQTWLHEGRKFLDNPVMGTGFFHRGYESKLWYTGSHNFWLQMFLESGAVGGVLVLLMIFQLWRIASAKAVVNRNYSVPLKAVLITAFIGGLSGEYYYGSTALIVLLIVFSSAGDFQRLESSTSSKLSS